MSEKDSTFSFFFVIFSTAIRNGSTFRRQIRLKFSLHALIFGIDTYHDTRVASGPRGQKQTTLIFTSSKGSY